MKGRLGRVSRRCVTALTRHRAGRSGSGVALTVYHTSADVNGHVALLKRLSRYRVTCVHQREISTHGPVRTPDLVLWELAVGQRLDGRRLGSLVRGAPVVTYSVDHATSHVETFRSVRCAANLQAPFLPIEIERQLILAEPLDLFARLKKIQSVFRRYLWNHEVWLKIHRGLNTSVEPKEIAESLVEHASRLLPVPWWAVVVPDKFSSVKMVASLGPGTELQRGALPLGEWVMRHGHDAVSADLSKDKRIPEGPAVAALGVPMVSGCQTVGALVGLDRLPTGRSSQLGKPLLDGLGALVEPAAVALDHAVELKRLESLSVIDDLTRLYNSSFLSSALHRETRRTSRTGNPLSLLFIDLDNFNTVNDSHGHLDGSRVLVESAQLIQRSARETDIVARFGGDEFVVVLPDTGSEGARVVAERVRGNFAKHRFLATAGFEIRLTASIGVAVLPEAASTADELLRIADCAMYAVKAQGKNGILVAEKADGEGQLSSWRCSVDQSSTGQ